MANTTNSPEPITKFYDPNSLKSILSNLFKNYNLFSEFEKNYEEFQRIIGSSKISKLKLIDHIKKNLRLDILKKFRETLLRTTIDKEITHLSQQNDPYCQFINMSPTLIPRYQTSNSD